jgi:hypothetical protein
MLDDPLSGDMIASGRKAFNFRHYQSNCIYYRDISKSNRIDCNKIRVPCKFNCGFPPLIQAIC